MGAGWAINERLTCSSAGKNLLSWYLLVSTGCNNTPHTLSGSCWDEIRSQELWTGHRATVWALSTTRADERAANFTNVYFAHRSYPIFLFVKTSEWILLCSWNLDGVDHTYGVMPGPSTRHPLPR